MNLKTESMPNTTNAMSREADKTTTALFVNSERVGQETFCTSSL